MSFDLNVAINDAAAQAILSRVGAIADNPAGVGRVAAFETLDYIKAYTAQVEWKGADYMAGEFSGEWVQEVVDHWMDPFAVAGEQIVIRNDFAPYHHKVVGGTISAQNVANLTIPIVPEAKGRRAADYESNSGNKLFRAKNSLAIQDPSDKHAVIPIYALKPSVTHDPWPGALPPEADIASNFLGALQLEIDASINAGGTSSARELALSA